VRQHGEIGEGKGKEKGVIYYRRVGERKWAEFYKVFARPRYISSTHFSEKNLT